MAKAAYGPVRTALETTLASTPKLAEARHAALVSLCRVTAEQVDQAGSAVSSRLIASYLSALKDLDRALTAAASTTSRTSGKKSEEAGSGDGDEGSALGALRGIQGGKAS